MARKSFRPREKKQSDSEIVRTQDNFGRGWIGGPPASEIPRNSVEYLFNAVCFKKWIQGRFGSRIYTETFLPRMQGTPARIWGVRTGDQIVAMSQTFTDADIGNYWVWEDGEHDEILDVLGGHTIQVRNSGSKSDYGYLRGKHNGWFFHKGQKKLVIHLGSDLWVADNISLTGWTLIRCVSVDSVSNAISDFDEFDEDVIEFNSNGIFKLKIDQANPIYYRLNTPTPAVYVTENTQTTDRGDFPWGRRYIYSVSRLSGSSNIRTRRQGAAGVVIEAESGPNQFDADEKDYGEVWSELPRGDDTRTNGVVQGPVIANANLDAVGVWAPVTNGTIGLTVSGVARNVWIDFTGVQDMDEVASRIQLSMRVYWPESTCEFTGNTFKLTSGEVDASTIGALVAGTAGTDITAAGYTNLITGTITNGVPYETPRIIGRFTTPVDSSDPTIVQRHWTHYSIYGTKNIGVDGVDPVTGEANNSERYTWLYDLRIHAAFLGSRDLNRVVTATQGEFEQADVGSVIEWDNGDRDTITEYISSTSVRVGSDFVPGTTYVEEAITLGAFVIGNGRVFRASQSGIVVTRTHGDQFTAADVGKTLLWSSGYTSLITQFNDANNVHVQDSTNRVVQGVSLDPVRRNFYDTIPDDILRARIKGAIFNLRNRTWEPLPLTNMGRYVPGWIFTAIRGDGTVYYQQIQQVTKYLAGYHHPGWQVNDDIKNAIQSIQEYPNKVVFFCTNATYGAPTNTNIQKKIPETGVFISIITGVQAIDAALGVIDFGSITDVDVGKQAMKTNDDAIRLFNGFKFDRNLAEDEEGYELVMDELRAWANATASGYKDGELFFWGQQ